MNARTRIGMLFSKLRIPADAWTVLILLPGVISLYFLASGNFLLAGVFFLGALLFDVIDGAVAHVTTKVTRKGVFLDGIVSSYLEVLALIGLALSGLPEVFAPASTWVALAVFGFLGMEYSSILAKHNGLIEQDWMHLVIKPTRTSLLLIIIFSAHFNQLFAVSLLIAASVISVLVMLNRQFKALTQ
ncbi:hypothetical protein K8R43_05065 [archaeon]|nr:hypothetical protein [archaeon]